ncbi:MAG: hypothetical protein RLZZ450_6584 [Pseudomonadota bacterium]|jgi:uncharacterized Zn-binding protein involved in type VI secretion
MFDPSDYIPGSGASVLINGLPRSTAGSEVKAVPHISMGGPFLKPPGNEGELFMGSSTVVVEGDPMGFAGLPVLSCQDIGLPAPFRTSKSPSKSLYLPTSIVLPIPTGPIVLIGGAPTVSMSGLAMKALSKGSKLMVGALKKSKLGKRLDGKMKGLSQYLNSKADSVFKELGIEHHTTLRNKVRHTICTVTGHPVDVATGKLFTDFVDFELPGPLPFKLERIWYSTSTYVGPLGHGWHASFDMALAEDDQVVAVRMGDGRVALFPALNDELSYFNTRERLTLTRVRGGYRVLSADSGLTYGFSTAGRSFERAAPLSSIEDRDERRVSFHNDHEGRVTHAVDAGARRWDFRYHPTNGLLSALVTSGDG